MRSRGYLALALLTALSIGIAAQPFSGKLLPSIPSAHAASQTVVLFGDARGWNFSQPSGSNPMITVGRGDSVTIQLSSVDGATHQFALDADKDGVKISGSCSTGDTCSKPFSPSAPTSITIDTTGLLGIYAYFCTFHTGMAGQFVVVGGAVGGTTYNSGTPLASPYILIAALIASLVSTAIVVRSRRDIHLASSL